VLGKPGTSEPEAIGDARRFKLSEASIAGLWLMLRGMPDAGDGVWAQNVEIVWAFLAAATQWRVASISGGLAPGRLFFIGLDYAGARIAIEAVGLTITPKLWFGVQVMEEAARDALNARR
jgi:hypothetical protein